MRKISIFFGVVALLIGGCVALVFTLTAGLPAAADAFFSTAASGDVETAYEMTASGFQDEVEIEEMIDFLDASGLDGYDSATWSTRSFENEWGYLEGTVTTDEGELVPLFIDLLKEDDTWKVYYIELL